MDKHRSGVTNVEFVARSIALAVLLMMLLGLAGEYWLRSSPSTPPGLSQDESTFAEAALLLGRGFPGAAERAVIRKVRVNAIELDLSRASDTSGCGICNTVSAGPKPEPCAAHYLADVGYYTWFHVPIARLRVHCDGAKRMSFFEALQ